MTVVPPTIAERLARAAKPAEDSLRLHALCRGKMQTLPKCPIRDFEDFAVWYSPGVAGSISDGMAIAVAHALAGFAEARDLREDHILPRMDEWDVHVAVAVAAAMAAQAEGLARLTRSADEIATDAARVMRAAREATALLMQARLIPEAQAGV